MKVVLMFFAIFSLGTASSQEATAAAGYSTKPNTSGFPFPSAFPEVSEDKALPFDWRRYIDEAVSEGDHLFRARLAFSSGFTPQNAETIGIGESAADEMTRNQVAADEAADGCLRIETMYRDRLRNDAGVLATLEEFIGHQRKAIEASIKLVGGSWGGSGARVAYPAARLAAFVRYRAALLDFRESLHFQDLPEIAYPTPGKARK